MAARYERRSIILISNLSFAEWGSFLRDEALATALSDMLHHAEVISINGRSYRTRQRMLAGQCDQHDAGGEKTGTSGKKSIADRKGGSIITGDMSRI